MQGTSLVLAVVPWRPSLAYDKVKQWDKPLVFQSRGQCP